MCERIRQVLFLSSFEIEKIMQHSRLQTGMPIV